MFQIDKQFLIDCFRQLVEIPSPVGYDVQLRPVLERYAAQFGKRVTYDRRARPILNWKVRTTARPCCWAPTPTRWV